jgi:toxin YoeB
MNLLFTEESWNDYLFWLKNDIKLLKRINKLIKEIKRTPFLGIGKPEPLKFKLAGCWSRRINDEHRLIYEINKEEIRIISCRYHY